MVHFYSAVLIKCLVHFSTAVYSDVSKMSYEDTIKADPNAQIIFRGYEKLSEEKKHQLKDYVEFLLKRDRAKEK